MRAAHRPTARSGFAGGVRAAACALCLMGAAQAGPTPKTYLALGDSLAFGLQIAKLKEQIVAGAVRPESFDIGYVDVLAAHLRGKAPNLTLVNLGCPGESTTSFVNGPCGFATSGKPFGTTPLPLHASYPGAQLATATDYLTKHSGEVGIITLDIGINDLRAVQLGCPEGDGFTSCVSASLPPALDRAAANLRTIQARLRAAAPDARILVGTYYNWLAIADSDSDSDRFVEALNGTITAAATEAGAGVVDVFPAFNRSGDARARLCDLTLFCTAARDLHPSDAGYRVIGDLFVKAADTADTTSPKTP